MDPRTDMPLQTWRPAGPPRGYILVVHGLNTRPSAMQPWVTALLAAGLHVTLVILTGHQEPRSDETAAEKRARRQAFRAATREGWLADVERGYQSLDQAVTGNAPRLLLGYSLGGLLGLELMQQGRLRFDRMLLLAPALAMHRRNWILRWLPLPRGSLLPSAMPRRFRAHRWTPLSAYLELFRSVDALHSAADTEKLNIPARVWIDPRDELVSPTGVEYWIRRAQLDNWRVSQQPIGKANLLRGCFHHLIIDPSCTGERVWQQFVNSIDADLLAEPVVV